LEYANSFKPANNTQSCTKCNKKIIELKKEGTINPIFQGTDSELASFLLFGIHGILHEKPFSELDSIEMEQKKAAIMKLIITILGIKEMGK